MESNNPRSVCVSYSFDSLTLIPVDGGKWSYGLYHCPIVALTAACAAAGQATCADCGGNTYLKSGPEPVTLGRFRRTSQEGYSNVVWAHKVFAQQGMGPHGRSRSRS
jgi:hypothetical protein